MSTCCSDLTALQRAGGRIPCVQRACPAPPWDFATDLACGGRLDAAALTAHAQAMHFITIDAPAALAARAAAGVAESERIAAIGDLGERARALRLVYVEEDLTLRCPNPHCGMPLLDWEGCAAITCRARVNEGMGVFRLAGCGHSYCGLCFLDCGSREGDAHPHVATAHKKLGRFFFSPADYAAAHKARRLGLLKARFAALGGGRACGRPWCKPWLRAPISAMWTLDWGSCGGQWACRTAACRMGARRLQR